MTQLREVTLYGKLADPLGALVRVCGGESAETVREVRDRVAALEPRLGELLADPRVRACTDGTITTDGAIVQPGRAVEFIPVVSGG